MQIQQIKRISVMNGRAVALFIWNILTFVLCPYSIIQFSSKYLTRLVHGFWWISLWVFLCGVWWIDLICNWWSKAKKVKIYDCPSVNVKTWNGTFEAAKNVNGFLCDRWKKNYSAIYSTKIMCVGPEFLMNGYFDRIKRKNYFVMPLIRKSSFVIVK